jgi:hypothetical protein
MTIVKVSPNNQVTSIQGTCSLTIDCIPTEPVKAFQLNISFDPTILQATLVQVGDFFGGYQQFFNNGTIDNTVGAIYDIYNLTIGSGSMVTNPGSLARITFTNINTGISPVQLNNVIVTNEEDNIPFTTEDGSVSVYNMQVTDSVNLVIPVNHGGELAK